MDILVEMASKSSDGMVIFDNDLESIAHINSEAQRITGLRQGSPLSDIQLLLEKVSKDDRQYIESRLREVKGETRASQIEFKFQRKKDQQLDICTTAYSLLNDSFIIVFLQDITKNKEHENYLIEFGTKKNTTLDGIVHFLSGAVTLMRNLSVEAGNSMKLENITSMKTYLKLIDQNSSHCLEVIKDLLQEEHGKSPKISIKKSRVNVIEKIGYVIENLRLSYPNRIFDFIRPPKDSIVDVDEIKMLQIINNYAFNAIKFSSIETPITLRVVEDSDDVTVSVIDAGIGIPLELQPYIFDRDTIAGRTGLNGEESFGIGLSICKDLASIMGCKVWFDSQEGNGSTFFLSIPKQ